MIRISLFPRLIPCILILLSSLAYLGSIVLYAQNVPSYDDYVDILPFILSLSEGPTLTESLTQIFQQYNQHFILSNRLTYSLMYWLSGEVNFYYLILIANLNIALLGGLYCWHSRGRQKLVLAATSCVLLFQLSYFHTALWAMASMANFSAAALTLLSLTLLSRHSRASFVGAASVAFLACFSLGSGIFVLFGGFVVLAVNGFADGAFNKRRIIAWGVFSALTLALFLGLFEVSSLFNDNPPPYNANVDFPLKDVVTFIALVGSPIAFDHTPVAIVAGVCLLGLYIFCCARGAWRHPAIFAFSLCLLAALAVLTQQRSWAEIQLLISTERYRFVALNFLICVILMLPMGISTKRVPVYPLLLVAAAGFAISIYILNFRAMVQYSEVTARGIAHWEKTGRGGQLRNPVWVDLTVPYQNLKLLHDTGVYRPDHNVNASVPFASQASSGRER